MDKELLTLSANNDLDRLRNIVQNKISKDEMVIMVEKSFSTKDHNFMKLLMALFKGLQSEPSPSSSQISQPQTSSSATTKANHLFLFCVELLATKDMTTKLATDVVRLLVVEMDILNSPFLIKLSKEVIAYLRNPKIDSFRFLEILPKLLHQLRSKYSVATDTGDVKGAEFQNKIIDDICSIKWSNNSIVHLASIFKEVHLSPEELQPIMTKFFKVMTSMDIQEIPPLIYQLLILSSKGCKAIFLDGIINYFNREGQGDKNGRKDNGNVIDDIDTIEDPTMMMMMTQSSAGAMTSQLQQIEGTVIYHITSSIKQHQELGKEFVKYLKTNQHSGRREMLSSFVISLALSISKISAFESQVLELLKQIITYSYKDQRKKCESKWLRDNSAPFCDVTNLVMSSVKKMLVEWDVVMEGLVALGFSLMEVSVAKNSFGRPAPTQNTGVNILPSPVTSLNLLGSKMLVQCSKVHTNVAVEIVNQLINRIVTKGQEVPGHYKDLLVTLLKTSPHKYVENVSKFKDTFDYFSFLPLTTSHLLTTSLLPVVRICAPLKNGLVLFLRKSLFTRHLELRKIGVSGFLLLLKNFKVLTGLSSSQSEGSSSSQVAVDIHRDTSRLVTGDNKSLCLEIINSLRRCFGQQHDVRSLLYNGLCDVSEGNPALLGPIADLLLNQLKNYLDPNETNLPPLKVASCILMNSEVWQPAEPLADLVKNLLLSIDLLKRRRSSGGADDDDNEEAFVVRVEGMIESIVNRLIKCDVDDFEVEKDLGFDASTPAGSRNISLAQLAVEVCEVFMQREVSHPSVDNEKIESMLKLFQVVGQVVDSTRETEGNKKNKTKKNNNNKQTTEVQKPSPCILGRHVTLEFIITITNLMFSQQDDNISNLLLSNNNFCNYFFNSTSTLLQHLSTSDDLEMKISGRAVNDPEQVTSDLCGLARILLKRYLKVVIKPNNNNDISIAPTATNNNKNQPNSTKTLNSHCLKVFHQTLSLFSKKWIDKVPEFLVNLDILNKNSKRVAEKDPLEGIVFYIKSFQRVFITLLTTENESSSPKDRLIVMQCIVLMIGCCKKEAFLAECCDWFTRLFKEQVVGDSELLKLMLKELLTLLRRTDLTLNFVKDVCRDIHMCLGDVNQEVELDNSTSLPTVNHRSSVAIIQSILSHFESEIEDADWLIGQMRSQSANNSLPANEEDEFEEESPPTANGRGQKSLKYVCRNLIGRMSSMTDIFHELVQTNIPFGPSVELVFKVLNKFYGLLCSLAKLYIWNYGRKPKDDNIVIEGPFEKLIKHSALQLTRFIYPMINHIEKVESERLQAENEKHKNKKAKKNVGTAEKVKKMKETKLIPSLILSLEQYERLLIQLSKKSKVNLMVHFKISTSRDFRINNATLQGILEERGNGDDDDGGDGGSDDDKRSNDVSVAMGNDDGDDNDDDVEEEIENMVRNDEEDDADDANQVDDDDDCVMSAPARKRIKLADKTPQTNKATEKKKLSRKSK